MRIKGVKAIAWDLDGTLLDSFGVMLQIVAELAHAHGLKAPSREKLLKNYHGSLEDGLKNILEIKDPEKFANVLESFLRKQDAHYAGNLDTLLFHDAIFLAKQASGMDIRQLLITNREHKGRGRASPRVIVAETVLADYISDIMPGDEVEYRKPDKRSLHDWLDRHKIHSDNLLVIGDQFVDGQLAINLGARGLLVERNGESIPHLDKLDYGADQIIITDDLSSVVLEG